MSKSNYITTWVPTSTVYMILYARLTDEMTTWQCMYIVTVNWISSFFWTKNALFTDQLKDGAEGEEI